MSGQSEFQEAARTALGLDSPIEENLGREPIQGTVEVRASSSRDRIDVYYVANDLYPPPQFWAEDGSKGLFRRFRSEDARERFLAQAKARGMFWVKVEKLRDPRTRYAPNPDAEEGYAGVYIPNAVHQRAWREGHVDAKAMIEESRRMLAAYSAWSNGETCGVVLERFSVEPDGTLSTIDEEVRWCHLDVENARRLVQDMISDRDAVSSFGP